MNLPKNESQEQDKRSSIFDYHQPEVVPYKLHLPFEPCGDQPRAINDIHENLIAGISHQTLLGVTGSGKTFTMANVIAKQTRPVLIIAPNKTLAAQLYSEFKEFFPENRVRFFVSYYDYYQPEAYVPSTDTYIEKDASINEEIDKLRHAATRSLLEATDTIVVSSVSCIYGLGAPDAYYRMMLFLQTGDVIAREEVIEQLITMQYTRSEVEFVRGMIRLRGETLDIFPADEDSEAVRVVFFGDEIEELSLFDPLTGKTNCKIERVTVYPVSHYVTGKESVKAAIKSIQKELKEWLPQMRKEQKLLEAERLERRTLYDVELLSEAGFCPGVENYSRHLDGRSEGDTPTTLMDYFPKGYLVIIDESHVTLPQIGGMYQGDRSRKQTLVSHGFRLPSALDNRPLMLEEFWERAGQTIFVSATPGERELELSEGLIVEQVNRPTGLLDPVVEVRPAKTQVDNLFEEIQKTVALGDRVLVTTLTKRMAEDLSEFLRESGVRCRYLHSDIKTIERVEILRGLRSGEFDVLIGINLLREGLDLVEVSLVAILDADKEGFLRSGRSLIQTIGRSARNIRGRAILYADTITGSMQEALDETDRRRKIQAEYNKEHGITPQSARRSEQVSLVGAPEKASPQNDYIKDVPDDPKELKKTIEDLKSQMYDAAARKEFERAAEIRDAVGALNEKFLKES